MHTIICEVYYESPFLLYKLHAPCLILSKTRSSTTMDFTL